MDLLKEEWMVALRLAQRDESFRYSQFGIGTQNYYTKEKDSADSCEAFDSNNREL
jgi:hypothetical protein